MSDRGFDHAVFRRQNVVCTLSNAICCNGRGSDKKPRMKLEGIRHHYVRRLVAPALRGLGIRASTAIARRLARGVYEMNTPGRQQAEANLTAALADRANPGDISKMTAGMYEHMARFWTEALFIPKRLGHEGWRRFVDIENEHGLRALKNSGRGCVLATGYCGNIAAAACALGHLFRPVYVMVDWFAQPELASWQREMFSQQWVRPLDRRNAMRELPRVLSNGEAVLMVGEHERRRGHGITTRFLGKAMNCYPTLGRLARWYDVPVGVVTCRREARLFSFTLSLHDVVEYDESSGVEGVVRQCMTVLEHAIMAMPKQYLWSVARPAIEMEIESASCPRRRRTASGSRLMSAADKTRAGSAAATGPVPTE